MCILMTPKPMEGNRQDGDDHSPAFQEEARYIVSLSLVKAIQVEDMSCVAMFDWESEGFHMWKPNFRIGQRENWEGKS